MCFSDIETGEESDKPAEESVKAKSTPEKQSCEKNNDKVAMEDAAKKDHSVSQNIMTEDEIKKEPPEPQGEKNGQPKDNPLVNGNLSDDELSRDMDINVSVCSIFQSG